MTINFGDLRKGIALELDGQPWEVMDYERHKMQQRAPVTRLKLRNLKDGKVIERTFQSYTTEFALAQVEDQQAQFLYTDGQFYYMMDMETYDQYQLTKEQLGDVVSYLKEETVVDVLLYNEEIINIRLPTFVDLEVTDTPPAFKGDTASGGTKPATLETGAKVQVPLSSPSARKSASTPVPGQYIERA